MMQSVPELQQSPSAASKHVPIIASVPSSCRSVLSCVLCIFLSLFHYWVSGIEISSYFVDFAPLHPA